MTSGPEGDVCRYDEDLQAFVAASLVDWQAFYLYRALARWRDLDAQQDRRDARHRHQDVPFWIPAVGTWDTLESRLFARWGSAPGRWWDRGPQLLPRYACLVCHDTGRVRGEHCPGCHPPAPVHKPRKRDWVQVTTPSATARRLPAEVSALATASRRTHESTTSTLRGEGSVRAPEPAERPQGSTH